MATCKDCLHYHACVDMLKLAFPKTKEKEIEQISTRENNCRNFKPTADVVPRAEVAGEIVEFLFRRSKSLQHLFKDNPDSAQWFRGRFELENAAVIIANEYGVDLKKKYTEGEK